VKILGICGSLRKNSFNMHALRACNQLMPEGMSMKIAEIGDIPLFNQDVFDAGLPAPAKRFREEVVAADGLLIASPEYNFSLSAALKNAIDWGSRPYGTNSFARKPAAVIGTSPGAIGTAVGQAHLRSILTFVDAPQMAQPEAYIQFRPGLVTDDGEVTDPSTEEFLRGWLAAFKVFTDKVTSVNRPPS